jgi:hypothetical protein
VGGRFLFTKMPRGATIGHTNPIAGGCYEEERDEELYTGLTISDLKRDIRAMEKGKYQIVQTGIIVQSDSPNAP